MFEQAAPFFFFKRVGASPSKNASQQLNQKKRYMHVLHFAILWLKGRFDLFPCAGMYKGYAENFKKCCNSIEILCLNDLAPIRDGKTSPIDKYCGRVTRWRQRWLRPLTTDVTPVWDFPQLVPTGRDMSEDCDRKNWDYPAGEKSELLLSAVGSYQNALLFNWPGSFHPPSSGQITRSIAQLRHQGSPAGKQILAFTPSGDQHCVIISAAHLLV